jgi:hypothetical protein
MFLEISQKENEAKKKDFDSKYEEIKNRGDGIFKVATSYEDIQESNINNEINKNKDSLLSEIDKKRRLRTHNTKAINYSKSLYDNLSIGAETYQMGQNIIPDPNQLDFYVSKLSSEQANEQYLGLVSIRKLLSLSTSSPVQEIIDRGVVFVLVNFLNHQLPEFVYEATTCLTSICSGTHDQSNTVVMKGGAKRFIQLCDAEFFEIQEQAILGIGNLAAEGTTQRDKLIELGALDKISKHIKTTDNKALVKSCLFSLASFTRGTPPPSFESMDPVRIIYIISYSLYL